MRLFSVKNIKWLILFLLGSPGLEAMSDKKVSVLVSDL